MVLQTLRDAFARTPQQAECGIHLCYGDYKHRHFAVPEDLSLCVMLASAVSDTAAFVHLPVDRDTGRDPGYFEPLRDLSARRLALGVIDYEGDPQRTAELAQAASAGSGGMQFAVATECGTARIDERGPGSPSLERLLELHAQTAAPGNPPSESPPGDSPSSATFTRNRDHLPMARVLVVDDEPAVRRALERALRLENHEVALAADGEEALDSLVTQPADAVILDILMPKLDGLEVCRRLRKAGDRTPVLMLTARDAIDDRVEGLDVGADDYLVKPFALRELQARLRALLRRAGDGVGDGEVLRYADLELDPVAHEVRRGDRLVELSRTEFLLLELFLRHPRQVLTRSTIFENVWGYDFGPTSNALGVYMGYLRRKTEAGGEPRLLHTVRGVGYALKD